ncbi:MAG: right-handed parallel beta-helix repeat-containing protein [Phycisphaerae bacterium]|nr:right-handed parallel beta-helix repeat-containing protein [Phycisphaerae bacterium]
MFQTKMKTALSTCAALVVVIGCTGLAQEAAKPSPAKNIVYVATDGTGNYKTDGTDDQVEINQALLDIHKKGGGTVHLKKGTYTIGDSIVIYSDTILEGDGWTSVIKLKDHAGWPRYKALVTNEKRAHRAKGVNANITIRNLKIDGNRGKRVGRKWSNQEPGWGGGYYSGIGLRKVNGVVLSGLWIGNNLNDQIEPSYCKNITVRDCTLEDGGHDCIKFYGCDTVRVLNNRMIIRCNCGVRLYGTNHAVIRGNIIHPVLAPVNGKGGNGIQIQYSGGEMNDILIERNTIFGVMGGGIQTWTEDLPKKSGICSITVKNNVFYHCRAGGIRNHNFDMLVENNTFFMNKKFGIGFSGHYRGGPVVNDFLVIVTARNNIVVNNVGYGLATSGFSNARILSSHNNVWKNAGGGRIKAGGNYDKNVKMEHDISVDPRFVNASVPFGSGPGQLKVDLHLKSRHGRWDGKKWLKDDVTSPCIDAGDPKAVYSHEPLPNGKRINMGAYGNTKEASKSTGMVRGTISGKVTDKETGKPVLGAKLSTGGYFGTTDAGGNYTILDVPAGEYSLKVSAIKYVEQAQKVKVSKDGKTVLDLGLVMEKVPPTVKSHSPAGKSSIGKIIIVAFSEPMNVGSAEKSFSVSPSTAGSFRWIEDTMYFIPEKSLEYGTKYRITIEGAEDLAGNKLKSPHVREFSTLSKAEHLVGEWRFEEESGNTAKDSSGRGNHVTLKGNPARVEGKVGKALGFDGVDDLVEVPHNDSLIAREEITIEAWVKPDYQKKAVQGHTGIAGKAHRWDTGYLLAFYNIRGGYRPWLAYGTICEGNPKRKSVNFSREGKKFGSWVHLAATRDFHGNVKTYIDGEQTNAVSTDPVKEVIAGSERGAFRMGYYANGRPFKGIIDEVRIYNRALSPAEIKADFGRTK